MATFVPDGSPTPRSSSRPHATQRSRSASRRARRWQGRSPTGESSAIDPTSASSSRRTSSCPTATAAGKPMDTPGAFVYGTGPPSTLRAGRRDLVGRERRRAFSSSRSTPSTTPRSSSSPFAIATRWSPPTRHSSSRCSHAKSPNAWGSSLTFMGKPLNNRGGSGLHINFSFRNEDGVNVINDEKADDGLSELAKHSMGGLLEHHQALAGICAPTVNAYKRLRPASLSGYWANWGYDHRGATIRVPAERGPAARLEHRLSDGGSGRPQRDRGRAASGATRFHQ